MMSIREDPVRIGQKGKLTMAQYLLSMYQPDGPIPPPDALKKIMEELGAVNEQIKSAGQWVFSGGLHPSSTATVLRMGDGKALTTDGPFVEGKEHIGGFWILDVPDLDAALSWAGKILRVTKLPMEVRPFKFASGR
jgi:hypothetical protein